MWKEIAGYEGLYEVSDTGQIRVVRTGLILKQFYDKDGYPRVNLTNEKKKQYAVHRILATAFLPNPEQKPVINHKDGKKQNNSLDNLEWSTVAENTKHGYEYGMSKKGERHYACKLTDEQVVYIKKNYSRRDPIYGAKPLSELFGVSLSLVSKVALGVMRKG